MATQAGQNGTGMPRLHFAMLTYGALDATRRCVRTLRTHTSAPFELWIVDNASPDTTPQWLAEQREPWLHWRQNASNRGVPGGRNDLLDFVLPNVAPHDWLVFVDNDLEFEADWLAPFLRAIAQHPDARVLGKVGHFVVVHDHQRTLLPAPAETGHVDVVSGGYACFVRADAARKIGRFDERLGQFWHEDDDWCVRALQLGFDVIAVPEAAIAHHEHASGVAVPDLENGGSLDNLRYLTDKWRAAGMVDRDGWLRRETGPYLPETVRDELRRRQPGRGPIGRTEAAAAIELLAALLGEGEPAAWFVQHRRPIPACTWPLLQLHLEQARQLADTDLTTQLQRIELALRQYGTGRILHDVVRVAGGDAAQPHDAPAGHGVCRGADCDDPAFLAVAEQLGSAVTIADPYARSEAMWQAVAIARWLLDAMPQTMRCVGPTDQALLRQLHQRGVQTIDDKTAGTCLQGHRCDAVLFTRSSDPDVVTETLAAYADDDTLVLFAGDVVLNSVPSRDNPQPHQLALDLLDRARLRPLSAINLCPDAEVLEACATDAAGRLRYPLLGRVIGAQLLTSYVVAARRIPSPRPSTPVLTPASPLSPCTLRVGVDMRTLFQADSTARGIGKFTTQHLAALCDADPGLRLIGYTLRAQDRLPPALQRAAITTRRLDDYRPEQVDLVHLPDPMNLSFGFDSPLRVMPHDRATVTFHDLTPLHHYVQHWPRVNREAYLDRVRQLEHSRCQLLTNSVFTQRDALEHTAIPIERTTAILAGLHHDGGPAPTPQQVAAVQSQLGIRGPFVLHVGAHDPHKNFYAALNAFLMARAQQPLQLVVVGAVDIGIMQAATFCAQRKVPDVLFTGYLPRQHLDALYASATALLFLSRAEGFGLPILEAMAKGCPVIASDATSHPEVAGDAALLVDPDDQAGAAHWLRELLRDATLRERLRVSGQQQAQRFPWQQVAARTLAVWHSLTAAVRPSLSLQRI